MNELTARPNTPTHRHIPKSNLYNLQCGQSYHGLRTCHPVPGSIKRKLSGQILEVQRNDDCSTVKYLLVSYAGLDIPTFFVVVVVVVVVFWSMVYFNSHIIK
jgi:hypothetical protein